MRHHLAIVLAAAAAACPGTPRTTAVKKPRVVVLVVVDQWPLWTYERDRTAFRGGFARLAREGAFARIELPYANTLTAPGHATIGTGAPPSVHGILGNQWWRRADGRERSAEYDPDAPALVVGESQGGELSVDNSASAAAMRVDGLAESLRAATQGRAHSVAIGLKARASAFVAGKKPDLVVWYEPAAGGMTTSRAYAAEPPAWLHELAAKRSARRFFNQTWTPLDTALLARITGIGDDRAGEGDQIGFTPAFPHPLTGDQAKALVHTPFADELEVDAALAALDAMQLGTDDVPDLLAICFNAHDYAGHMWGPESWEVLDLTLRLDALLGKFFDTLDTRYGRDGWAAVVTSDHGSTPLVERSEIAGSRRVPTPEIARAIDDALGPAPDGKSRVAIVTSGNIYFTGELTDEQLDLAATAAAHVPNIASAGRTDKATGHCETRNGLEQAACLSVVSGESGELYIMPLAGSLISDYKSGTHHDAPFDDNRFVPLFVLAPGIGPQTSKGSILQVAPTVAALLGIPPPPAATEKPLFNLGK